MDQELVNLFEDLLGKLHTEGFEITDDFDQDEFRVVMLKKRNMYCNLKMGWNIFFDVYAELTDGIYEIGDLHHLTRNLLNIKKICLDVQAEEMNTTERLYPENRRGKNTQTSRL